MPFSLYGLWNYYMHLCDENKWRVQLFRIKNTCNKKIMTLKLLQWYWVNLALIESSCRVWVILLRMRWISKSFALQTCSPNKCTIFKKYEIHYQVQTCELICICYNYYIFFIYVYREWIMSDEEKSIIKFVASKKEEWLNSINN